MSPRSVQRSLRKLEASGYVRTVSRKLGSVNDYTLYPAGNAPSSEAEPKEGPLDREMQRQENLKNVRKLLETLKKK